MNLFKKRDGFIALISVMIILAFVLMLTAGIAFTSYWSRGSSSESYYKEVSRALAESCVQEALLKLAATSTYAGNETITVATSSLSTDTCLISTITASGTQRIISAQGSFQNTFTNIHATVNSSDLSMVGWEEVSR